VIDEYGTVEVHEEIQMRISLNVEETLQGRDEVRGDVRTRERRSELLAELSAQGAFTLGSIPLPVGSLEEHGLDLPEAHVLKISLEATPPALRTIAEYYATEVKRVVETFGDEDS